MRCLRFLREKMSKRLLIIDNSNLFLRSYVVNPSLSRNGDHVGGIIGTLKSLQKICRETKPDAIVIAWDGRYGSKKRRQINKNYKEGRRPVKFNWDSTNMTDDQQLENKVWQMEQLSVFYDIFPTNQFLFEDVEADDVIAYVSQMDHFAGWKKIICSSDKDFIQLLDKDTILYRPAQKEILNEKRVIEKFNISPENFALARSIAGDKSDAIEGVAGLGLPTIAKRFPQLAKNSATPFSEIFEFCKEKMEIKNAPKAYSSVLAEEKKIRENYKIIQLSSPSISIQDVEVIRNTIKTQKLSFNKTEFKRMLIADGVGEWNWTDLYACFNRILAGNRA